MANGSHSRLLSEPDIDRQLKLLHKRERRLILQALLHREGVTDVSAVVEDDRTETLLTYEHSHLPELASAGYIQWHRETGEVSRGPRFDDVAPLIELLEENAAELPVEWP